MGHSAWFITVLKILHIITGLSVGGAERALFSILAGGLSERFDNQVVSMSNQGSFGPRIKQLNVPVHELDMSSSHKLISGIFKLKSITKSFRPDILQGWMYHGNLGATLAKKFTPRNTRLIWNIRHSLYDLTIEKPSMQKIIGLNRFFSNQVDNIIYNSTVAQQQHENYGIKPKISTVIPNGFDLTQWFASQKINRSVRNSLKIPDQACVIGHVARFHKMKEHTLFLKVAVNIANQHPNSHFLLCGKNVTSENTELVSIVPNNLAGRFYFLGETNNVHDLMRSMDIFCLSSSSEGFPNVLGEAMATSVPCVATNVGDCAAIIGNTGKIVPAKNEKALIDALNLMIGLLKPERKSLGDNARKRIDDKFSIKSVVRKYSDVYHSVN